jgi:hypothetical protein
MDISIHYSPRAKVYDSTKGFSCSKHRRVENNRGFMFSAVALKESFWI